jgi:hypothetical protein
MHRAADGLYDSGYGLAVESAAAQIALSNGGSAPCGVIDEYGRCSSRYHALGCSHGISTDWMAQEGGPPAATYEAALANFSGSLDLSARDVWADPDGDEPGYLVPQQAIELAHEIAADWGWTRPAPAPGPRRHAGLDVPAAHAGQRV